MISLVFTNVFLFLDIEILTKLNPKKRAKLFRFQQICLLKSGKISPPKKRIGPHYFLMKLSSFMICFSRYVHDDFCHSWAEKLEL
jgi:hypothetical protein